MNTKQYKVLMIENDEIDQKAFERFVLHETLPYAYTIADSVKQAKALLYSNKFDIVLTDHNLGDGTSFDIFDSIKDTPFVVITGAGDAEILVTAMKAGAYDCLIKDLECNYLKLIPMIVEKAVANNNKEKLFKMLSHAIMSIKDSVFFVDKDDNILFINNSFSLTYGYEEDEIIGKSISILQVGDTQNMEAMEKGEFYHKRKDGSIFPVCLNRSSIKNEQGIEIANVGILTDISETRRTEQHLETLANYDVLTGLPNRILFYELLKHEIATAKWTNTLLALLFVDLDHFKVVNDALGHNIGDLLLVETAKRLETCLRTSDIVSRIGGDEFTIILRGIVDPKSPEIVAEKIISVLSKPFDLEGHEHTIGASIGISLFPNDSEDVASLVKNADIAMYQVKESGRNSFQFYNDSMNDKTTRRLTMVSKLRKAHENKEFILYYQPQIDIRTGSIKGMEVLIRWQPSGSDMIPPKGFIQLAEETGLIIPIGEWVINTACKQNKKWQEANLPHVSVAVNISGQQFSQSNIFELIQKVLKENNLKSNLLELELTERIIMRAEATIQTLQKLKDIGTCHSIDDFGTGYSSLNHLKQLPIDKLKIAQSFVSGITKNPKDEKIVKVIIDIAHNMELDVIAEGVETKEQLKFLKDLNCDEAQGYLFCKPLPVEQATELLTSRYRYQV